MPFVRKPDRFSSDVIIPGRTSDPDGFVTEHRELDGIGGPIKVFFSVAGLRQLAKKYPQVGLVPATVAETLAAATTELHQRLADVTAERDELLAKQARIAGFAADGFKVQKMMGRPPEGGK